MMKSKKDRKRYREHMGQIKPIVRYKFKLQCINYMECEKLKAALKK